MNSINSLASQDAQILRQEDKLNMRIAKTGTYLVKNTDFNNITIKHNLGYVPSYMAFMKLNNVIPVFGLDWEGWLTLPMRIMYTHISYGAEVKVNKTDLLISTNLPINFSTGFKLYYILFQEKIE